MRLFSRTFVVALVSVAVALAGLFLFSSVVIPILSEPIGDGDITHVPSPVKSTISTPTVTPTVPTVSPQRISDASVRPLPGHGNNFRDVENARLLERHYPQAADTIKSLTWIADGVSDEELEAAEALIYLAATSEKVFDSLTKKPWLNNDDFRQAGKVVVDLEYIAHEDADAAQMLLEMPFLDTLQPADALAVESLSNMAYFYLPSFRRSLNHPAISDGITDEEARIVALLDGEYEALASMMSTLFNPAITTVEERSINLPLAGDVTLAIIRTKPGAARSMDLLESAVRNSEELMGEPFPAAYVPLLFTEAVVGDFSGSHNGSHIAVLPEYDVNDTRFQALIAERVIFHEVAHYYWRWSRPWLDEGAAEFITAVSEHFRTGRPVGPFNYPCGAAHTIRRLEGRSLYAADEAYICDYAVGERFFLNLYQNLEEEIFWYGFRSLYRHAVANNREDTNPVGIEQVRDTFVDATGRSSTEATQVAIKVIDRWYQGNVPEETAAPDPTSRGARTGLGLRMGQPDLRFYYGGRQPGKVFFGLRDRWVGMAYPGIFPRLRRPAERTGL